MAPLSAMTADAAATRPAKAETARRIVAAEYDEIWRKPAVATKCRTLRSVQQVSSVMAKAKTVLPLECAREMLLAGLADFPRG